MLQGYRTILFNLTALVAVWINESFGLTVSVQDQEAIVATIIVAGNLIIRIFFTKAPVARKVEEKSGDIVTLKPKQKRK